MPLQIALVQIQTSSNWEANLSEMEKYIRQAVAQKAKAVLFPEMAYYMGPEISSREVVSIFDRVSEVFSAWAKKYSILLLPGSVREPAPDNKYYNTLLVFGPDGELMTKYRKIFLFRADLPDRRYEESKFCSSGDSLVTFDYEGFKFGVCICFDIRFPELFRSLRKKDVDCILLPAAFTVPTGIAHWEVLLRARAIENQVYLLAPDQTGVAGNGAETYGHSLALSPWGEILGELKKESGLFCVTLDKTRLIEARQKVSAWESRRTDLFPIA
jgi:nitrilase